jgi:enoyl-CoA hydratase/carnithine racemase
MPETSSGFIPDGYGTVTPWLISTGSAELIGFLESALGAEEIPE